MRSFKIWDKIEQINGVDASYVIESHNIKDGDEVFLILDQDRVVAIEISNIIKSVYKLDPNLTVEQVAGEYLKLLDEQEKKDEDQSMTLEQYKTKVDTLEKSIEVMKKENADLNFALISGGVL